MSNNLVIGLGGTGGKIIRAFRRTVFQEFRSLDVDGVHIGYLYMDSSKNMMDPDDPSWKILGSSVQLGKDSQVLLSRSNLKEYLDEIDRYPGIKPWIGNKQNWAEILNSIVDDAAGGQKRRLGRFLFAVNYNLFTQVLGKQVKALVEKSSRQDVTFHICAGLAGGTGSGTLIDVIGLIRDTYPPIPPNEYRIMLYLLLPEHYPLPGWDTGNYHANGYSALTELNALSVGSFSPCNISGTKSAYDLRNPFSGCYIFSNRNENGLEINIDKEVPSVLADFLYQKLVAVKDIKDWETLKRQENAENGDNTPEKAPNARTGERSKRFLSFGIKRIAIPEEEIKEYITYNYARQAALQLKHNNWTDEFGFVNEGKNQDFAAFVKDKETLFNWSLSDEHLCQSIGILPEDKVNKKWKPIGTLWETIIPNFVDLVKSGESGIWPDELAKLCEKQFVEDYRGIGVRNFYAGKLKAKKEIVKEIRKTVEKSLFDEWKNGVKSFQDLSKILTAMITFNQERLADFGAKMQKLKDSEETAEQRVNGNRLEWSKLGLVGLIIGKKEKLLGRHAVFLQDSYTLRTTYEGYTFSKQILQELDFELNELKNQLMRSISTVSEAIKKFDLNINERCKDGAAPDMRGQVVRFYDPEVVRTVTNRFIKDEKEQKAQTSKVRSYMVSRLGESPSFSIFNERISPTVFLDLMESVCEESAIIAHNTLVQDKKEKILGVSIIEKMKERFEGDEEGLRKYIGELVRFAGNYLSFEPTEINKKGPGIPDSAQTLVASFSVIIPKAPAFEGFVTSLKDAFRKSTNLEVNIIETDVKQNEISMISLKNLFPLRYVADVNFLKQKYEMRTSGEDAEKSRLMLNIESDGFQHPKLFVMTSEEAEQAKQKIREESLPYLLLAKAMNLIQELEDPATGRKIQALLRKNKLGLDADPLILGKTLSEAADAVDTDDEINELKKSVDNALASDYMHVTKRSQVREDIIKLISRVKEERGGNILDPVCKKFNRAAEDAIVKFLKID